MKMRRIVIILTLLCLIGCASTLTSCKSSKVPCPAYQR